MPRLHDWQHQVRAKVLREAAYANPGTRCWRCRRTLAEVMAAEPSRKVVWHAGHTGGRYDPLMAECSLCNLRDSARMTTAKRVAKQATSGGSGRF